MTNIDSFFDVIGYAGALFLSISFIPQTYSLFKSNNYDQIRYMFLYNTIITSICMSTYGIYYKKYPVVIGNASVFINSMIILYNKSASIRNTNSSIELVDYNSGRQKQQLVREL